MRIKANTKTKKKMAYPIRGVLWLPEEVECLIQTLLEMDAGPRVITSTHLETQGLFEEVDAAMHGHDPVVVVSSPEGSPGEVQ
ncbi:UNVERIFIED_CONTAM: hypothetical protein K2H54_061894 [Gekko kuhli]